MIIFNLKQISLFIGNIYSAVMPSNDIDQAISNSTNPRTTAIIKIFGPLIIFLWNNRISPTWIMVIIMALIFFIFPYRKYKKEGKKSEIFYLDLFILIFFIIGSVIGQIVIWTKVK
ncbi:MAG: hypothetical protein HPY53_14420 [Brevinematales bacterium]|nr:hypothetical protein [Brevinematales bacterium]